MHPHGDRTLDELLAASAPVTDHDLDRPQLRAAARALIEELPMPVHPTASPTGADGHLPLGHSPTRAGDDIPDDALADTLIDGLGDTHVDALGSLRDDTAGGTVAGLPARADRPRPRGRRAVGAAAAALVLALGAAALVSGGDGGDPVDSVDPAAGPTAAGSSPTPAQPADPSDTACELSASWLDARARGDQVAQDRVVARVAEVAAAALAAGDEQRALETEALMAVMSEGTEGEVAVLQAHQADSCTG